MKYLILCALLFCGAQAQAAALTLEQAKEIVESSRLVYCEKMQCHYEDTGEYFGDGPDGTMVILTDNRYTPVQFQEAARLVTEAYRDQQPHP